LAEKGESDFGDMRNSHKMLLGKPEGKRPLEKPRYRWEYNTKMDLREMGLEGAAWIHLDHDRDRWRILSNGHEAS
jgi:hypothetical protein